MYKCLECNKEFQRPEKLSGLSGEFWGRPFQEYYKGCPYCKAEYISKIMFNCDCCNTGLVQGDTYYETKDGVRFCEKCITEKEVEEW